MNSLFEFANPLGWWWALLAVPIIAFYILKVRLKRQRVSTFMFWDRVFEEKKPRAWWQHLRHWLSLLLQLAVLLLLVGSLVDPLWKWQKIQRSQLVLVVDNSASMAALNASGRKRLDEAKQTASALIRSLREGDEMAILTSGGRSAVAIGLTDHVRSLLEALDHIELTDAPTALASTVATARRLLPEEGRSHIYVLTDGCDPATVELAKSESVSIYGFGEPVDNVAITQFQVRRNLLDAIGYQLLIEVTNLGDRAQKCQLDLSLEEQLVDVIPLDLEPGESQTLNLDQASSSGGRLVATLDVDDGLATDNRAMALLPARRKMPVTLVTPGSLFLRSVLESIPLVDLTVSDVFDASIASSKDRILILHQQIPAQLPPGKLFVIDPRSDTNLWRVGELLEQSIVGTVKDDSPLTQHVKLVNVPFPQAHQLEFNVHAEMLISTPLDEPLLSHIRRPEGDIVVLNLDLDQGDLPLRIAFPVFMKNAIEWFQGVRAELEPSIATGNSATVKLKQTTLASLDGPMSTSPDQAGPPEEQRQLSIVRSAVQAGSDTDLWVRDPRGKLTPLAHDAERATIAMLTYCGLWTIGSEADLMRDSWRETVAESERQSPATARDSSRSQDKTQVASAPRSATSPGTSPGTSHTGQSLADEAQVHERLTRVASNLCNREESDLRPRGELARPKELGLMSLGGWSIWFYLAMLALALVTLEWWLYQRRVVG